MADHQSTFESSLDFTKPMGFSADMSEHIDPSNLISSYQPSDIDWLSKDPFEILPWDLSGIDQPFNPFGEGSEFLDLDPRTSYATSNHGSPAGYGGYTVKTEDAMSDASPLSDAESETWSPIHSNDNKSHTQSPIDVIGSKPRGRYESETSPLSTEVARPTKENIPTSLRNNASNSRKTSNASLSSPSSSSSSSPLTSPKMTASLRAANNKSTRSTHSNDPDAAAMMKRKKAAHNAIEKRYRTNMNAKFLALGNAIPRSGSLGGTQLASTKGPRKHALCHTRESLSSAVAVAGRRQQEQQQNQQQQNKSEILTNALAYINELQDENSRLKSELLVLKENLLPGGNMMWRR